MTSKRHSLDDEVGLPHIQEKNQCVNRCSSSGNLLSEVDGTSGYDSSSYEESLFGSVQERKARQRDFKRGEDRQLSPVNTALTEADATKIYKQLGRDWRFLGWILGFPASTLDNISDDNHSNEDKAHFLLIKYIRQYGSDATKGRLAEALFEVGRRDIAENLIGKEHFASKTPEQQMFLLKEEGSFIVPDENGKDVRFFTCRSIDNDQLYLVRELVGTGYEESCKVLKQQHAIADSILKALDVNGIVKAEKQKIETQKFKEAQEKIVDLLNGLREIANSLEKQKNIEDSQHLLEDETLLGKMQNLATELLHLTGTVSHLEDRLPLETQMYSVSLGLCASLRDLQQRVIRLSDKVPSDTKVPGQVDPEKLLKWIRTLEKQMKMREKPFEKRFQELTIESQKRPRCGQDSSSSEPQPRTNTCQVDVPGIRRASTQPVSEDELRKLREEVAPPPDPMEKEQIDVFSNVFENQSSTTLNDDTS